MDKKNIIAWFWLILNAISSILNGYIICSKPYTWWIVCIHLICALANAIMVIWLARSIYMYNRLKEESK